jgi:hypothetical protein
VLSLFTSENVAKSRRKAILHFAENSAKLMNEAMMAAVDVP